MTDPLAVVAVSVPEAARLLSVSVSTIRKLAPPVRIGRRRLVSATLTCDNGAERLLG